MPGISAVSPPTRAAPAWRQPSAMPATTRRATSHVQLAGGVVVQEHQRLGALGQQVVDAHGHQIDADGVVMAALDGDLQLGADAVGGGDDQRIGVAGGLEVEEGAEAAQRRVRAGPAGRLGQRLDRLDQGRARVDVDAGLRHRSGRSARSVMVGVLVEAAGNSRGAALEACPLGARPGYS